MANDLQQSNPLPTLGMTLAEVDLIVKTAIERIDPDGPEEQVVMMREYLADFARMAQAWKKLCDEKFIEVLKAHGDGEKPGQIQVGTSRYYVGTSKRTTCRHTRAALETLLDATGADFDAIVKCLVAQPFKPGMTRSFLYDGQFESLFETKVVEDLKTGKPKQGIKCIDEDLMKALGRAR